MKISKLTAIAFTPWLYSKHSRIFHTLLCMQYPFRSGPYLYTNPCHRMFSYYHISYSFPLNTIVIDTCSVALSSLIYVKFLPCFIASQCHQCYDWQGLTTPSADHYTGDYMKRRSNLTDQNRHRGKRSIALACCRGKICTQNEDKINDKWRWGKNKTLIKYH